MSLVIEAQRSSSCDACSYGIRPGQMIQPTAEGGWEHVRCPEARPVCGVCFTQVAMNGACSCP